VSCAKDAVGGKWLGRSGPLHVCVTSDDGVDLQFAMKESFKELICFYTQIQSEIIQDVR
jgi:hypothetical protein